MKKAAKMFISVLLAMVMASAMLVSSLAANTPGKIDYVAFGDSVSAGVRGGVGAPGSELGSDKSYTNDIAALLQAAGVLGSFNHDFCTSGMTAKLLAQNTAVLTDKTTDAAKNVADAEIATIDIGANDLLGPLYAYVGTLKNVSDFSPDKAKEVLASMIQDLYHGTLGTDVGTNIEKILQNILTANASVKIYVMGYYNPLPSVSTLLGVDLNEPTKYFNTFIQGAIKDVLAKNTTASITYVPTFDAMAAAPGSLVSTDIHPTESGYQVIAGEFWKSILPLVNTYRVTAAPSTTPIVTGGITLPFDAYLINGNNYVKLRDVAMVLSGTTKQVSITYDSKTGGVSVTSGQPYTPVGGELVPAAGRTAVTAFLSPSVFTYNGAQLSLTAYLIGSSNYIKLRDLGQAFNFGIDYNPATGTVTIDTTKGYTVPAN